MGAGFRYAAEHWIALLALAISAFVLYRDRLRPFRLSIRGAGRITIARNPWSEGLSQACIELDLIFANEGAARGVVEDVAIHLAGPGVSGLFRAYAVVLDRQLNLGPVPPPPRVETFIAFEIRKDETVVRRLLLVPHSNSTTFFFALATYEVSIWARSTVAADWLKHDAFSFTVEQEDLDTLAKASATPQPSGGFFIDWFTRDKPFDLPQRRLDVLADRLQQRNQ